VELIGCEDEQKKGKKLKPEDVGKKGQDEVSPSLEGELKLASAVNVPLPDNPDSVKGAVENHEANQDR
jgi:hypothetical protein